MNLAKSLKFGLSTLAILAALGCQNTQLRNLDKDVKSVCEDVCREMADNPDVFVLVNKKADPNSGLRDTPNNSIYVKTPDGMLQAPNKREGLDPRCFSESDFSEGSVPAPTSDVLEEFSERPGRDRNPFRSDLEFPADYVEGYKGERPEGNLWATDLNWNNTTITFINFDADGRLESRVLTKSARTKAGTVLQAIDRLLNTNATQSPINEYKAIQYYLTHLQKTPQEQGRPLSDRIDLEGFNARDLRQVPIEKTPFYTEFDFAQGRKSNLKHEEGHVFFYVLLDEQVRFNRDVAAMIPYAPGARNDIGHLYTPFIQYPIVPEDPARQPGLVDVLTVHFIQGGTMTQNMPGDAVCTYPYDIGVLADAQSGFRQKTPLMIDPEVKARGVLP